MQKKVTTQTSSNSKGASIFKKILEDKKAIHQHFPVIDMGLTKLRFSFISEILALFCKCWCIAFLSSRKFLKIEAPLEFEEGCIVSFFCILEN